MIRNSIRGDAYMDVGGTIPGMESVESSPERRPGKRQEQVFEGAAPSGRVLHRG